MPAVLPTVAIVLGAAFGSVAPSLVLGLAWWGLMLLAAGMACLIRDRPGAGFSIAVTIAFSAAGAALAGLAASRAFAPGLRVQHDAGLIGRGAPVEIEGRLLEDAAPTDYGASLLLAVERTGSGGRVACERRRGSAVGRRIARPRGASRVARRASCTGHRDAAAPDRLPESRRA